MEPIVIRVKRQHNLMMFFSFFVITSAIAYTLINDKGTILHWFSIVGLFCLLIGIVFLVEFVKQPAELIFSASGIFVRDKGDFHWSALKCIKTTKQFNTKGHRYEYLILQFYERKDIKLDITDFERSREEIVSLIGMYSNNTIEYLGHHEL
jgi:hypothetical protein